MSDTNTRRYPAVFRSLELLGFGIWMVMATWLAIRLAPGFPREWPLAMLAVVVGFAAMDFISGFAHWAGDTWGSVTWPLIGPTVLRTFREHHVDPESITRHDVIEVNATNALIALPVLGFGLWAGPSNTFLGTFALTIGLVAVATNQIHLWAHRKNNPGWVRFLQRTRVILSPEAHEHHHARPYTDHYCITTGWLNGFFAKTRFWRALEWVISKATGAIPREEDVRAAQALAENQLEDRPIPTAAAEHTLP